MCEILHHSIGYLSVVAAICGDGGDDGGRIRVLGFDFGGRKGKGELWNSNFKLLLI